MMKYNCGLIIDNINSWDTTYNPTIGTLTTTFTDLPVTLVAADNFGLIGYNYTWTTQAALAEAFTLGLEAGAYGAAVIDTNLNVQTGVVTIGAVPLPNFYKYPEFTQNCFMYESYRTFLNTVSDYSNLKTSATTSTTINIVEPTSTNVNCQGQPFTASLLGTNY